MASSKALMARLERVERDSTDVKLVLRQVAGILSDQGDRLDRLNERVDRLGDRVDQLGERLGERLDRLIAVTMQERTYSIERFADIERRLSRLEEHAGF
jgi:predicted nuclease with TOPRIM domain